MFARFRKIHRRERLAACHACLGATSADQPSAWPGTIVGVQAECSCSVTVRGPSVGFCPADGTRFFALCASSKTMHPSNSPRGFRLMSPSGKSPLPTLSHHAMSCSSRERSAFFPGFCASSE